MSDGHEFKADKFGQNNLDPIDVSPDELDLDLSREIEALRSTHPADLGDLPSDLSDLTAQDDILEIMAKEKGSARKFGATKTSPVLALSGLVLVVGLGTVFALSQTDGGKSAPPQQPPISPPPQQGVVESQPALDPASMPPVGGLDTVPAPAPAPVPVATEPEKAAPLIAEKAQINESDMSHFPPAPAVVINEPPPAPAPVQKESQSLSNEKDMDKINGSVSPVLDVPSVEQQDTVQKGGDDSLESTEPMSSLPSADLPPPIPSDKQEQEFQEQKSGVEDLSKQADKKMTLTPTQKANKLGVEVGKQDTPIAHPQAKIEAAFRALDLERYEAAYDMFTDLYKTNKRDERILMGRAVALQKLGRDSEALAIYDELLDMNPDNPDIMTNMLSLVRKQNPSAALSRLMELRNRYPNNATIAAQVGLAYAGMKKYEEGMTYLRSAAEIQPDNPNHYFNMAVMAERMGNASLAISEYEKALEIDATRSNDRYEVNRGVIYDRLSALRRAR